jgi:hypothetical protein
MIELFSTTAVAMAGLSMGLIVGSALADRTRAEKTPLSQGGVGLSSNNGLSPGDSSAVCQVLPTTKRPTLVTIHQATSLKFSAIELRAHARSLGLRNARWRNSAKKVDLVLAIRDYCKQREAA